MTREEVKDETRQSEGDPRVRARIRAMQRAGRRRMMQDVPKADVVITNPTHFAVAIQYDPEEMAAPIVVAKGAGAVAQRIRKLAPWSTTCRSSRRSRWPRRVLYKEVEIGHPIPQDKYAAVAEVLAYVYRLKGKVSL